MTTEFLPYVTVGRYGIPEGHATKEAAIEYFFRCLHGAFLIKDSIARLGAEVEEKLAGEGRYRVFSCGYDGGVQASGIFERRADQPIDGFRNWHIGPGRSWDYLLRATENWQHRKGPRVGDYITDRSGKKSRFTHAWDDGIQTGGGSGSYHITRDGFASYSGGLDPQIPYNLIEDVGEFDTATFWFFFDGSAGAHRGLNCQLPTRNFVMKGV